MSLVFRCHATTGFSFSRPYHVLFLCCLFVTDRKCGEGGGVVMGGERWDGDTAVLLSVTCRGLLVSVFPPNSAHGVIAPSLHNALAAATATAAAPMLLLLSQPQSTHK